MNFKKYLEKKKDGISKRVKMVTVTSLTVATILTGSSALTSCDKDNIEDLPDVNYSDLMSMIDEDINNFNEGFEYAGFMIGRNGNQYALIFLDEKFTDNASYNITKKQFDTIMESVKGLSIEDGVQFMGEDAVNISNEVLKLDGMEDVRKILADVVQKQDPFRAEMIIAGSGEIIESDSFGTFAAIENLKNELAKEYNEFSDFQVDEIIVKPQGEIISDELEEDKDENSQLDNIAESKSIILEIRDYYDSNNDGIDDKYKSFEVMDDMHGENLLSYLESSMAEGKKNLQFKNGQYVFRGNFVNGNNYIAILLCECLENARINMDSIVIDAPIENAPEMAD